MSMDVAAARQAVLKRHHDDDEGSKLGMWLFLLTELLLFAGMFLCYAVYRSIHIADFHLASHHLNVYLGTINTLVLLTSSLTVVLSISALQRDSRWLSLAYLGATISLAFVFLIIKSIEWGMKFHHGMFPGGHEMVELPKGQKLFFDLYYVMTGLHGLHVIIGAGLLSWTGFLIFRKKVTGKHYALLENSGLYWHLVDIIWIFLFPLFYLVS